MTKRSLPQIKAFAPIEGVEWDVPVKAREHWQPLAATHSDDRTLAMTDEIGDRGDGSGVTVPWVRGALRRMGAGPITVNINSTGGDFFAGLAIYNMLREHEGEVTTNILGVAASAASLIAMASDNLLMPKAGFLMIHNAWALAMGNRHDMRTTADLLEQFDGSMASVYSDRSGMDQKRVAKYMDDETFFNGETAVENGFADGFIDSDKIEPAEESAPVAAARQVDLELARSGVPRAQRRALVQGIKGGTPGAASTVTPRADDYELLAKMRELTQLVSQ